MLKFNHTVASIEIPGNEIGDEGCKASMGSLELGPSPSFPRQALADGVKSNCAVTYIDLMYNEIGDEGCKAMWCSRGLRNLT